ncbi:MULTISPECIES: cupin domain-containing protein [Micrococcales]|uniref:cupin domain-containing protein n=1 Tax=Micrococcales TaxID=85006 RepID=UPI0004AB935A|nr:MULTISPECIES: cupin domain-containing protein [Micrococcales]
MPHTTRLSESVVTTEVFDKLPIVQESTTSRVLVNNALLRQVTFSMDAGQILTEHASSRAVVVTILGGRMVFTVSGTAHTVTAGDSIFLAPNERHAVEALEPSRMSLTLVRADGGEER